MDNEVLRNIGLTNGEIKVYNALIKTGQASSGPIMNHSGISSSKVYLILEKLMQKGLISSVIEAGVKQFFVTNPIHLVDYLENKQLELEKLKQQARELAREVSKTLGSHKEESAQVYRGIVSMRSAFQNIWDELKRGEEFLFFGVPEMDQTAPKVFFRNMQRRREELGIKTKGIIDVSLKAKFASFYKGAKGVELKFLPLGFPHACGIGKTRVVYNLWDDHPIAFEIKSERITNRYRSYFNKLWKNSKQVASKY